MNTHTQPSKVSSNDHAYNKYLRGFDFWNANRWWHDPSRKCNQKSKDYYDAMVEQMRIDELNVQSYSRRSMANLQREKQRVAA